MISPDWLASASRFIAAHLSIFPAHQEQGMSGGDQLGEWVLKSPTTRIGMFASMSIKVMAQRPELSWTLW